MPESHSDLIATAYDGIGTEDPAKQIAACAALDRLAARPVTLTIEEAEELLAAGLFDVRQLLAARLSEATDG